MNRYEMPYNVPCEGKSRRVIVYAIDKEDAALCVPANGKIVSMRLLAGQEDYLETVSNEA